MCGSRGLPHKVRVMSGIHGRYALLRVIDEHLLQGSIVQEGLLCGVIIS